MIKQITGHTKLTGLLGRPVTHSISPMMHNEGFRLLQLDYAYLAFDVGTEQLKTAVDGFRVLGVRGFNCTMPDKTKMCELSDQLSPAAKMIGAVNTVSNENGVLVGHNTDGIGYMRAVKDAGHDILGKHMTLLGAGGASTAILVQAALDGVTSIDVFNRKSPTFHKMEEVLNRVKKNTTCNVAIYDMDDKKQLTESIAKSHILVNGSSVGMAPNTDDCLIKDFDAFHSNLVVSDIIYNPEATKLIKLAKERGCKTFNGLYMLLYQGAEAFRIWTNKDMPIQPIKDKFFTR